MRLPWSRRMAPPLVQLGIEPGALQPAGPVLRPPIEAPGPRPRPVLLLSLLAVPLLGGAYWARTRRSAAAVEAQLAGAAASSSAPAPNRLTVLQRPVPTVAGCCS